MIKKKLKCIQAAYSGRSLVLGKIYELKEISSGGFYYVGSYPSDGWGAGRFVEVGCPCGISTCLTHRIK